MRNHDVMIPASGVWECWEDDCHCGAEYSDGTSHELHMLKVGDTPVAELTRVFEGDKVTETIEVFEDAADRVKGLD